jgi:hypothetical protein
MEASVLLPDLSRFVLGNVTNTTTGVFPWDATLPDGAAYRVDVLVETLDGCKRTFQYWLESTATNCCLTPVNIVTRLLQEDGPGQRTRVRLQNRCSTDLTLQSIRIVWDNTKFLSQVGQERLEQIVYPAAAGDPGTCPTVIDTVPGPTNTNTTLGPRTVPAGVRLVAAGSSSAGIACGQTGSDDYEIEIRFNKAYDPLDPPVTQVCIIYMTGGEPNQQCQILPGPSAAANVCDAP